MCAGCLPCALCADPAAAICPTGSAGGNCRLRLLDLGYNKLGTESSFAAVQAVQSWVGAVPNASADVVKRFVAAKSFAASAGDLLRELTKCPPGDDGGFGILKGLLTVYLCGNNMVPEDVTALAAAVDGANGLIETALCKVEDMLLKEWDGDVAARVAKHEAAIVEARKVYDDDVLRLRLVGCSLASMGSGHKRTCLSIYTNDWKDWLFSCAVAPLAGVQPCGKAEGVVPRCVRGESSGEGNSTGAAPAPTS